MGAEGGGTQTPVCKSPIPLMKKILIFNLSGGNIGSSQSDIKVTLQNFVSDMSTSPKFLKIGFVEANSNSSS